MDKKNLKKIHKLLFVKKFKDYIYKSKFISTHQESIDINIKNWDQLDQNLKYKFIEMTQDFITLDSGQSNLASGIKNQFKTKTNIYTIGMQKNLPPNNYDSYFYLNTNHIAIDTGIMHKAVDYQ